MDCKTLKLTLHAYERILEREIKTEDIFNVVETGEVIEEYPSDKPYPSCLILGYCEGKPLHVVVAKDEGTEICFVITSYEPEPASWSHVVRKRRSE
uniref:DUF4258 domain-containing protein n=1 Tax=Leptospirillum ferriphilum TaxID=178606 RepID=A0A7C3QUR5_9BACT